MMKSCNVIKSKWMRSIIIGALAASSLSFSGVFYAEATIFRTIGMEIDGVGLDKLVLLIGLCVFFYAIDGKFAEGQHWTTVFLALVFSGCMLIGMTYSQNGSWAFIIGNKSQMCIAFVVFLGFYFLFYKCLQMIYCMLNKCCRKQWKITGFLRWIEQHWFVCSFVVICVAWLPFWMAFLPGSVPHDGYYQLNMAFGITAITNQHPWCMTLFMGAVMGLGQGISDNFGIFLLVLLFFLFQAFCYASVCRLIKKWKTPFWLQLGSCLYFAVVPVFGAYAQAVIKDGIYSAALALYMALYTDMCIQRLKTTEGTLTRRWWPSFLAMFILGMLVCVLRNNGIYLILPSYIVLIFLIMKKKKRYALLLLVCTAVSFYEYKNVLTPYMGVGPESTRGMLSIPFQQTARYLRDYPEDVTEEEAQAINKVLKYETLAERYKPEISDPVKNTFRRNSTEEDLKNYFKAWKEMFLKHPGVYLEATLNNSYGYYYPFYNCQSMSVYQFYIKGEPIAKGNMDIHYIMPKKIRTMVSSYAGLWRTVPGLSQVMNPGTYTWILLIMVGYLIYCGRWRNILLLAAPLLNVAVCIASPVNGYVRYAMPVMACMPALVCWCLICGKQGREVRERYEQEKSGSHYLP